tara:strand:+ start:260 stop:577 length:318 start_codon:yes stop_codon:yes gene_type:complete
MAFNSNNGAASISSASIISAIRSIEDSNCDCSHGAKLAMKCSCGAFSKNALPSAVKCSATLRLSWVSRTIEIRLLFSNLSKILVTVAALKLTFLAIWLEFIPDDL